MQNRNKIIHMTKRDDSVNFLKYVYNYLNYSILDEEKYQSQAFNIQIDK